MHALMMSYAEFIFKKQCSPLTQISVSVPLSTSVGCWLAVSALKDTVAIKSSTFFLTHYHPE